MVEDEPRWHASIAVLVALALYVTLPNKLTFGPIWVAPLLILGVLVPLSIVAPNRHGETRWQRAASIALIAIVNLFNLASVLLLVYETMIAQHRFAHVPDAQHLLIDGAQVWLTNILVYGLWYWEIDGGGPEIRAHADTAKKIRNTDFLFPQMSVGGGRTAVNVDPQWKPLFLDYLYIAFTNALAFSPADVMPLTRQAKMLMLVEATTSFVTIAVVLARAVGVIGS